MNWTALPGERFELGEGLRFVDGRLVLVDILSGRLLEIPSGEGEPRVLATGAGIAGLGEPVSPLEDAATMRMNDGAADADGRTTAVLGDLTDRRTCAEIPDGMTVDAESHLWTAIWGAGEIRRFAPDGTADRVLPLPASQPTSVCLTGTHLYVTTPRRTASRRRAPATARSCAYPARSHPRPPTGSAADHPVPAGQRRTSSSTGMRRSVFSWYSANCGCAAACSA